MEIDAEGGVEGGGGAGSEAEAGDEAKEGVSIRICMLLLCSFCNLLCKTS